MPIKYGELTIIYNKEETSILSSFLIWMQYEERPPNKSKYVFLFDDGEICGDNKLQDLNFKFSNSISSVMPLYFKKKENKLSDSRIYFYKKPIKDKNDNNSLAFKPLFTPYAKFDCRINIPSIYNSIYYCHKHSGTPEIFGLIHIKSNEYMPRFQFAYDIDEFTKEEIIYLIHHIFNPLDIQNEIK
jgi:hypothetical protein